jgi:hypothetical protein
MIFLLAQLNPHLIFNRGPISALCSKNNPRNINYMPAVIFFACLDLGQKSSFMDGHYLKFAVTFFERDKLAINTMRYPDIIVNIHTPATGKIKYATGNKLYFCA